MAAGELSDEILTSACNARYFGPPFIAEDHTINELAATVRRVLDHALQKGPHCDL